MASPLISVADLADVLGEVTVLDVRYRMGGTGGGPQEYAVGHVPGAVFVELDTALTEPPGDGTRGRHPLPDPEVFAAAMRAAGVCSGRPVVVYDDWEGRAAARAWWLLRYHGHRDVRVLDGGWRAWVRDGREVEEGLVPAAQDGDFTSEPGGMPLVLADAVLEVDVLVDARAGERYRGETEPIDPVAGHVPGAVNVPTDENLDEDGLFRPAETLRETYAAVGAVPGADVAVYCGSGVTAAHDVLAMEVAGVTAGLYAGSWSEWVADASRPVATSARP